MASTIKLLPTTVTPASTDTTERKGSDRRPTPNADTESSKKFAQTLRNPEHRQQVQSSVEKPPNPKTHLHLEKKQPYRQLDNMDSREREISRHGHGQLNEGNQLAKHQNKNHVLLLSLVSRNTNEKEDRLAKQAADSDSPIHSPEPYPIFIHKVQYRAKPCWKSGNNGMGGQWRKTGRVIYQLLPKSHSKIRPGEGKKFSSHRPCPFPPTLKRFNCTDELTAPAAAKWGSPLHTKPQSPFKLHR
ncbi:hypothetical protein HNY73_012520 [Argiope bruennichi]|uniref:Uncharacterized protein n=1 Tax=Argiope bruennichi TaxID=94029 RepID=A0A8T0EVR3_ARGBR|nr:hypothetical protein HNY73_012520 [Argiope bruennichi]